MSEPQCDAGRMASLGGQWTVPCIREGIHTLAFSDEVGAPRSATAPVLHFCEPHLWQLIDAGLIDEPNVDPDEAARRW